jgi:hypothetical protein
LKKEFGFHRGGAEFAEFGIILDRNSFLGVSAVKLPKVYAIKDMES